MNSKHRSTFGNWHWHEQFFLLCWQIWYLQQNNLCACAARRDQRPWELLVFSSWKLVLIEDHDGIMNILPNILSTRKCYNIPRDEHQLEPHEASILTLGRKVNSSEEFTIPSFGCLPGLTADVNGHWFGDNKAVLLSHKRPLAWSLK